MDSVRVENSGWFVAGYEPTRHPAVLQEMESREAAKSDYRLQNRNSQLTAAGHSTCHTIFQQIAHSWLYYYLHSQFPIEFLDIAIG